MKRNKKNYPSEYNSWHSMLYRCNFEKDPHYHLYGGRGITVCDRWTNNFENFINDMGEKPSKEYSIDRIDSNGNYEPNNCKWATPKEQSNNTKNNINLEIDGEILNVTQWADKTGISRDTLYSRIKQGWNIDKILSNVSKKMTKEQQYEIVSLKNQGYKLKEIAIKFNISIQAISKICKKYGK